MIVALETISRVIREDSKEDGLAADVLKMIFSSESEITILGDGTNMTEAAARAHAENLKKK